MSFPTYPIGTKVRVVVDNFAEKFEGEIGVLTEVESDYYEGEGIYRVEFDGGRVGWVTAVEPFKANTDNAKVIPASALKDLDLSFSNALRLAAVLDEFNVTIDLSK